MKKTFIILIIVTLLICFSQFSAAEEDYSDNPMFIFGKWLVSVATKKWEKVMVFLGYRFNENMKNAFKKIKNDKNKMQKFLILHGVKKPDKFTFKNYKKMVSYIFKNSHKYKKMFKDVLFPSKKISIDYYHKENYATYRIQDVTYFYLLSYKYVRKLKLHLKSERIFFIRRDIKGWYIYPKCF